MGILGLAFQELEDRKEKRKQKSSCYILVLLDTAKLPETPSCFSVSKLWFSERFYFKSLILRFYIYA